MSYFTSRRFNGFPLVYHFRDGYVLDASDVVDDPSDDDRPEGSDIESRHLLAANGAECHDLFSLTTIGAPQ